MTDNALSQAQMDALDRIYEILKEHFDASLLAIATDASGSDTRQATRVLYSGGYVSAIGLANWAAHNLLQDFKGEPHSEDGRTED